MALASVMIIACLAMFINLAAVIIYCVAKYRLFQMLGLEGWQAFIPFYGMWCLAKLLACNGLAVAVYAGIVFSFVPGFGILYRTVVNTLIYWELLRYMERASWLIVLAVFAPPLFLIFLAYTGVGYYDESI